MLIWLAVTLVAGPLALTLNGPMSGAGWEAQGSTSQKVRDELRRDFPQVGAEAAIVAYSQQLVPSLLGLLGARAWWVPGWLDRRLPKVEFSH